MKIGLLSFEYPPETGFGGIGTYTWYQARGYAKLGHEVHVLAGATDPTELRSSEHDGVRVHRFRADGWLMRQFRRLEKREMWWTKNRLENALSMKRGLRQLMREHQFDVLEMPECGAEGAWINRNSDLNTVVKFHSPAELIMQTYDVKQSDIKWCSWAERRGIKSARAYMSCSQFLADEVKNKMGIDRHVEVIHNGIDLELFDAAKQIDAREAFDLPRDRLMVFFAGRMEPRKGIHLCKDMLATLLPTHDVSFVFAGQDLFGYVKNTLQPMVDALDKMGSFHYLGKLDLTQVRSCLQQADIFLIPSTWENCPYSCLEAMAAGRAILSSDAGGLPELISHEKTGLLAKSEQAEGFVEGLRRLIEDSGLRGRLGSAARQRIEESFTDVHIGAKTAAFFKKSFGLS